MHQRGLAEGGAQPEPVEGRDHRRALGSEELEDMVEHLVAAPPAEVQVDVRPVAARRVQEALEGEPVAEGVGVGQAQAVGDEAVRRRPAADAGDALGAGVGGEPLDQQEVGREAQALDRPQLVVQAVQHLGPQGAEASPRPVESQGAEARVGRLSILELDLGEVHAAERGRVAAVRRDDEAAGEHGRELLPRPAQVREGLADPQARRVVEGPGARHVWHALEAGDELGGGGEVRRARGEPGLGESLQQGPVLDGDPYRVVLRLVGVQVPGVRAGHERDAGGEGRLEQGASRDRGRGGRRLRARERGLGLRGQQRVLRHRRSSSPARGAVGVARGAAGDPRVAQAVEPGGRGGEQGQQAPGLDAPVQAQQQPGVVGEQEQPLLVGDQLLDEVEVRSALVRCGAGLAGRRRLAGGVPEPAAGDEAAEVAVARLRLDQGHHPTGTAASVAQLTGHQRPHGRGRGG